MGLDKRDGTGQYGPDFLPEIVPILLSNMAVGGDSLHDTTTFMIVAYLF